MFQLCFFLSRLPCLYCTPRIDALEMTTKCITDFDVTYGSALAPAVSVWCGRYCCPLLLSRYSQNFPLSLLCVDYIICVCTAAAVASLLQTAAPPASPVFAPELRASMSSIGALCSCCIRLLLQGFHRITTRLGGTANLNTTSSSQQSFLWTHEGLSRGNPVVQVGGVKIFYRVLACSLAVVKLDVCVQTKF